MNLLTWLLGRCWDHEPIKVRKGKVLHLECLHCQQDLGPILKGQKLKLRKEKKVFKIVKARKTA